MRRLTRRQRSTPLDGADAAVRVPVVVDRGDKPLAKDQVCDHLALSLFQYLLGKDLEMTECPHQKYAFVPRGTQVTHADLGLDREHTVTDFLYPHWFLTLL